MIKPAPWTPTDDPEALQEELQDVLDTLEQLVQSPYRAPRAVAINCLAFHGREVKDYPTQDATSTLGGTAHPHLIEELQRLRLIEELQRLRLMEAEHARLHEELNQIIHPNGDGPKSPSLCDLVAFVKSDLDEYRPEPSDIGPPDYTNAVIHKSAESFLDALEAAPDTLPSDDPWCRRIGFSDLGTGKWHLVSITLIRFPIPNPRLENLKDPHARRSMLTKGTAPDTEQGMVGRPLPQEMIEIMVEGTTFSVDSRTLLGYPEFCVMAGWKSDRTLSMTYRYKRIKASGTLCNDGEKIRPMAGLVVNVADTSSA